MDGRLRIDTDKVMLNYGTISLERDELRRLLDDSERRVAELASQIGRLTHERDVLQAQINGEKPPAPPTDLPPGVEVMTDEKIRSIQEATDGASGKRRSK